MTAPTVSAEDAGSELFGTLVSDMQEDIVIGDDVITGTLKYLDEGDLVDAWGEGNFLAIKLSDIDASATSVKAGMEPSQGSGLVEMISDPDKNGVWKVSDKDSQVFKVAISNGENTVTETYDLSGLTLETA